MLATLSRLLAENPWLATARLGELLDAGADIEGARFGPRWRSPDADACGFKQWRVAFRLVERDARITLIQAATLGPRR